MSVARLIETFKPSKYQILLNLSNSKERIFTGKVIIDGNIKNNNSLKLIILIVNIKKYLKTR